MSHDCHPNNGAGYGIQGDRRCQGAQRRRLRRGRRLREGGLGAAARQLDAQIGGIDRRKLHAGGDFAAKLGDTLLLPHPPGAAAARVLLIGLGPRAAFGRKQYRKALQRPRRRSPRPARPMRSCISRSRSPRTWTTSVSRARGRGSLLRANVQDSGLEDRRQAEAAASSRALRWRRTTRARAKAMAHGPASRRGAWAAASRSRATSRTCRPTSVRRPTSAIARWPGQASGRASRPRCSTRPPSRL